MVCLMPGARWKLADEPGYDSVSHHQEWFAELSEAAGHGDTLR
jgi:hypothetical protein